MTLFNFGVAFIIRSSHLVKTYNLPWVMLVNFHKNRTSDFHDCLRVVGFYPKFTAFQFLVSC